MKTFSALYLAWNIVLSDNAEITLGLYFIYLFFIFLFLFTLGLYPMKNVVRQKLTTRIPLRLDN